MKFKTKPLLSRAEKAMITRSKNMREKKLVSFFRKFYLVAIVSLISANLVIGVYRSYSDLIVEMASMPTTYAKTPIAQERIIEPLTVEQRIIKASGGENIDILLKLAYCESKFDEQAVHVNKNKTVDLGVLQINSIWKDLSPA